VLLVLLDAMAERERVADTASLRSVLCLESLVVIGAGRRPGSIGHVVLVNIITGGYSGQLSVVNPHTDQILGGARLLHPADPSG
jgi:acyl-CoA synthetase (NDP forming)